MSDVAEKSGKETDPLKPIADILFTYLRDVIYKPSSASLNIEDLPESFHDFGKGLMYYNHLVSEVKYLAKELSVGNLDCELPPPSNEIAAPLKMLYSSLKHLSWQTQQVAKGDFNQHVNFMGDFSDAFNNMIEQLKEHRQKTLDEKTRLEMYVQLIIANYPDPILLFDGQGKLLYASDSYFDYCKIFEKDAVLGMQIRDLFIPVLSEQSLGEIEQLYISAVLEEHMFETEHEIDFGQPESRGHFKVQVRPMLDNVKNVVGVVVFLFNVTDIIQARHEAERARELAEQSSHAKSNFLAKMSHEIRTPMNAVLGMAELALREDIPPTATEHIKTIKQVGLNLLSIINDILDFSKIEAGKMEIFPTEYLFSSVVNDVVNIIKTKILESRLRFLVNIDCNIPNVLFGDAIRIRQILLNLLSNAVKYTDSGFVGFSVTGEMTDDNSVILSMTVSDSGKGIKPEELEELFGEFTRFGLDKNRKIEGTGLGLAITRNFVAAMGGKIDVQSEYGKGSTFTVTLPQKVIQNRKIATIEKVEEKRVLVYDRREIYVESFIQTLENLGVDYRLVSTESDFFKNLIDENYSFVFLPSFLYEDIKKNYSGFKSNVKFAVIVEFGEAITDRNISILTMPVFSIPVANFLNSAGDNYTGSSRKEISEGFIATQAKILIVDDININLEVAEGLLLPYQMQIKLCKSGIESIEEIKSKSYDLVFMDQMMPEMDGMEVVSQIRALGSEDQYYKDIPIIALTANAVFGTREMFLENGFNDFLSKPIDISRMAEVLRKWIPKEKQENVPEELPINPPGTNANEKIIKINGLNVENGIALAGGNVQNYRRFLSIFYEDGVLKIEEITNSLLANNLQLYIVYVHALRSACAGIGAGGLSEAAKALELAGTQGDLDFIKAHTTPFLEELELLLLDIFAFISATDNKDKKMIMDKELLKKTLAELKAALGAFDSTSMNNAANTLQDYTQFDGIGVYIKMILKNKLIGEYDEAALLINELLLRLES